MGIDSTKRIIKRHSLMSSVLAEMAPLFPALDVLRKDVAAAQHWLQEIEEQVEGLILTPSDKPPDEEEREQERKRERLKVSQAAQLFNVITMLLTS